MNTKLIYVERLQDRRLLAAWSLTFEAPTNTSSEDTNILIERAIQSGLPDLYTVKQDGAVIGTKRANEFDHFDFDIDPIGGTTGQFATTTVDASASLKALHLESYAGKGNTVLGSQGDDYIETISSGGSDSVIGDLGDDFINLSSSRDFADGSGGNDTILGGSGSDNITGGGGNDRVYGWDGTDFIQWRLQFVRFGHAIRRRW